MLTQQPPWLSQRSKSAALLTIPHGHICKEKQFSNAKKYIYVKLLKYFSKLTRRLQDSQYFFLAMQKVSRIKVLINVYVFLRLLLFLTESNIANLWMSILIINHINATETSKCTIWSKWQEHNKLYITEHKIQLSYLLSENFSSLFAFYFLAIASWPTHCWTSTFSFKVCNAIYNAHIIQTWQQ